ncbi:VOC family protein [Cohnella faecalis]|uniref:Extradiol dioxygenase n=1 Tax=Cohnella faecalis TaxID=2315694 RepID=A0A398CMM8_9BACL|nr:VOC family protein [Cohnella faecalis]RIE01157.1 extradiol dioxygenase [Cohnella faecalis]
MAINDIWINLPVKDLDKSAEFFNRIGISAFNGGDMVRLLVGDKQTVVMLFPESTFQRFTGNEISSTSQGTEVLLSIGAESKEDVDDLIGKVTEAGGTVYGKPSDQGWMYGAGFVDLDGHRWNVLYMDLSQAPQK